jgi:hypothetical protein
MIIPFIYSNPHEEGEKGVKISLLLNMNTLYSLFDSDVQLDSSGLRLAGVGNGSSNFKGVEVAGLVNAIEGDLKGASLAGGASVIGGELNGFSYGTFVNYAGVNGRLAIQIGAFNIMKDYHEQEGTVIQIGLYNRAGNQSIPLLNIRKKKSKLESKV